MVLQSRWRGLPPVISIRAYGVSAARRLVNRRESVSGEEGVRGLHEQQGGADGRTAEADQPEHEVPLREADQRQDGEHDEADAGGAAAAARGVAEQHEED